MQGLIEQLIQESKKQHCNVKISCQKLFPENVTAGIVAEYEGTSGELVDDLISGILSSPDSSGHFNLAEEICGNVMGMMFHGCLTTSGIINGVLTRLAQHPKIQAKVKALFHALCISG